jgi:UDP-2,3-diacylglucosamine pyrophosphatase LpxH
MRRALAVVSDLHLGALPALDDFVLDERFASLLGWLRAREYAACEVALLGDAFDGWQSVDPAECEPEDIPEVAKAPSSPPAEAARLARIRARHPVFFGALAAFAGEPGRAVTFVAGNHDHALVDPAVQAALRAELGGAPVSFELFLDRPAFGLHAEHGNQFDANNRYRRFAAWEPARECRGYYFVRWFWNWLEYRLPALTDTSSEWTRFWREVRRHPRLLPRALRRFFRYVRAVGTGVVTPLEGAGVDRPGPDGAVLPPGSPTLLLLGVPGPNVFTDDPVMEHAFRTAYHEDPEMRAVVDEILAAQGRAPAVPPAGRAPPPDLALALEDEAAPKDVAWAERLYTEPGVRGAPLPGPEAYPFVLMGHTHDARDVLLGNGARYVNAGTWAAGAAADVPVVLAVEEGGKRSLEVRRVTGAGTVE